MTQISIKGDFITLGQLLKLLDLVSSGGEAKIFLQEYLVKVNGQRDDRRGRKLYQKDQVEIEGYGTVVLQ
jgi:S4 domain protein YaaA